MTDEVPTDEITAEIKLNMNPIFERELDQTLTNTVVETVDNPSIKSITVNEAESQLSVISEEPSRPLPEIKYTSHPISMRIETSNIKMVDLMNLVFDMDATPIAPDGYIPNSEIRGVMRKPFVDYYPTKLIKRRTIEDDSKDLLDEILSKYLPPDLMALRQIENKSLRDMALLAESRTPRAKTEALVDDINDQLNKDLLEVIDSDDEDEITDTNTKRLGKSKRKKFARQITKAALMNQIERKVKENEERRRTRLLEDEDVEIEPKESVELIDVDIMDRLDEKINDETLKASMIERELRELESRMGSTYLDGFFKMLFDVFGEEETYKLVNLAVKNEESAKENIDNIVNGRKNRLLVLNAVMMPPYAFAYVAYHMGCEDKLITTALMLDNFKYGDPDKLEEFQSQITDIMGSETKMAQFVKQLNSTLNFVTEKLRPHTDKSIQDIILGAFQKNPKDIAELDEILSGEANRVKFMNLIRLGKDKEIEEFFIIEKIKPVEIILEPQESEDDIFGELTDAQKRMLPSMPDEDNVPYDFFKTIAKVLQAKVMKEKGMDEESISSTNTLLEEKEFNFQDFRRRTQSIHEETVDDAQKALKSSGSFTAAKRSPSFYKDIYKSELRPSISKENVARRESRYESVKAIQAVGFSLGLKKSSDNVTQIQLLTEEEPKVTDLLRAYYEKMINKPWWPSDLMIDITSDSIILALTKILYKIAKAGHHLDATNCLIEFKKLFPPTRNVKKDVVQKVYNYLKEDSKGAETAMKHSNVESHTFYCKRVLNNLTLLKSLDEDINSLQEEFLRAFGDLNKKRTSRSSSRAEDLDRRRKESFFDPQSLIKKIRSQVVSDSTYVPEDKIKKLLISMTSTTDLGEKLIISAALDELRSTQELTQDVKNETITQISVYFAELREELLRKIRIGASKEEQQKIYNQLVKSSEILNGMLASQDPSVLDLLLPKIPFLDDLRRSPDLIKTLGEPFIHNQLQKIKEEHDINDEIDFSKEITKRERASILAKDVASLPTKDKPDKILFRRTSHLIKTDRFSEDGGSLRYMSAEEAPLTGTLGLRDAQPSVQGVKLHDKIEKSIPVKSEKSRIKMIDSKESRLDSKEIDKIGEDVGEQTSDLITIEDQQSEVSIERLPMRGRRMSTKGKPRAAKSSRHSLRASSKDDIMAGIEGEFKERTSSEMASYRESTSIRRSAMGEDDKSSSSSYDSTGMLRPSRMAKISNRGSILRQMKQRSISGETVELKTLLEQVKVTISTKLTPANKVLLENLITSLEASDILDEVTSRDQLVISKMLTELFVASQSDKDQIVNISKEMIHHFIEKIPLSEKTKEIVEMKFIGNLESLVNNLEEKKYTDREEKNELITRIKDITIVLKGLAEQDEGIGKRMDTILKISKPEEEEVKAPVVEQEKRPSLKTHQLLNEIEFTPILRTLSVDEREGQVVRLKMLTHLKEHGVTTSADLFYPDEVIDDLIKQRRESVRDTDKLIRISKAMFAVTQEASSDNKELMEVVASEAFTNLIVDMQNILSQTLKQFEVPVALSRCTTNLLLLQNLGIFGLEDFETELQTFKHKFPDAVSVAKNPLILDQISKSKHRLNLSKNELIIDNQLNFLRNITALQPMGTEKAVELGLILDDVEEEYMAMQSILLTNSSFESNLPSMFDLDRKKRDEMIEEYKARNELKENMMEIENLVKQKNLTQSTLRTRRDSVDSIVAIARDERPGSKTKLMKTISRNPALIALTNIGTLVDLDLSKGKLKIKRESVIKLPSISSLIRADSSSSSEPAKVQIKLPSKPRKLPPIKKKRVTISSEPASSISKQKDSKAIAEEVTEQGPANFGSLGNLRSRIKQEICKEYPYLADKINVDGLLGDIKPSEIIPIDIVKRAKRFHRLYGHDTTLLPFIGKSKSILGSLLDQGLRALHFNLGPGTLVKAILESERKPSEKLPSDLFDENYGGVDSLIDELVQQRESDPIKYMTRVQLRHCRMTGRPGKIPIHEWSKIAVPGTRHNLKHDLFGSINKSHHCPHHMLAQKHLHRHGISIVKHIERYDMIEIINKSIQESAYLRIQNSLLKCFLRVMDEN